MLNIDISTNDRKNIDYRVYIGSGILEQVGALTRITINNISKIMILTDDGIPTEYVDTVKESFLQQGFQVDVFTMIAGEGSKNIETVITVCNRLTLQGFDRQSLICGLGGGVIGDISGFVASIYHRGMRYINIPTTIIAQADSSIGGKTGVNTIHGKNLIGCYHQPLLVVSDIDTLKTLTKRIFNEGIAELIKHAVIAKSDMLDMLPLSEKSDMLTAIATSVKIKAEFIAQDTNDTRGKRTLLNFGHTVGHAIELATGYGNMNHGECVALGMRVALDISVLKAGLSHLEAEKVKKIIDDSDLPQKLSPDITIESIIKILVTDKKFENGNIRYILTSRLGSAFLSKDVTFEDIGWAIQKLY